MSSGGTDEASRVAFAFRSVVSRFPTASEQAMLQALYRDCLVEFGHDAASAEKLLQVGASPRNEKLDAKQLAAWTMVAHLILNLSETITRG